MAGLQSGEGRMMIDSVNARHTDSHTATCDSNSSPNTLCSGGKKTLSYTLNIALTLGLGGRCFEGVIF